MAHRNLVGGTAYDTKGGRAMVGGTAYDIKKGRTLVGGAGYDVSFSSYDPVFANNDWAAIIAACQSGSVPDTWAVGDSKEMDIDGTMYQVDIIGKNHDSYANGSGKAPLTLQLHQFFWDAAQINVTATNSGGWANSYMRTTWLPSLLQYLPDEVVDGLKEVSKASYGTTAADKLFLLSEIEVLGKVMYSNSGEGSQYAYYANGGSSNKGNQWWTRSPAVKSASWWVCIMTNEMSAYTTANQAKYASFAFCF